MDIIDQNELVGTIDTESKIYLLETTKWASFLSILGFILVGILVIASIIVVIVALFSLSLSAIGGIGGLAAIILFYILLTGLIFLPFYYQFKFAKHLKKGLETEDQIAIIEGFRNLKSMYKFCGILAIVLMASYALIMIIIANVNPSMLY